MGEPIRMMEPGDAGAVLALCRAEGWDTTAEDVADLFACPACGVVAEQAGVPIGVATAFVYGSFGWVGNVIVAEDFRGRGVGTRLVEALVQELRRTAGLGALILEARPGLESFYRRLGFLPLGHTVRYRRELIRAPGRTGLPCQASPRHGSPCRSPLGGSSCDGLPCGGSPFDRSPCQGSPQRPVTGFVAAHDSFHRQLCDFDRLHFGGERSLLLSRLRARATVALGEVRDGQVVGYLMARPAACGFRLGPWVTVGGTGALGVLLSRLEAGQDAQCAPAGSARAGPTITGRGVWVAAAAPAYPEVMAAFESTGFTRVGVGERMGLALAGGAMCASGPGVWALAGLDRG